MADGERLSNTSTSTGPFSLEGQETSTLTNCYDLRQSPPKAIVDSSPLQPAMDKNKESLKVKLMVRRPITQLVEQGIIPPLKTSPAIHEQCKQLERAKTGDLLKAKIQQRPNRQELERRHILEHDESHVDPSLAEKQRMLKKARLADQLNSQISHRPGPLELIKKNILHTEKPIERIVKEGLVSFKATSEGLHNRPQQPNSYITFEDDSQSSESDTRNTPPRTDVLEAAAASAGIVTVALTIPTTGGAVVVTSAPVLQTKFHPTIISSSHIPPPPPLPPGKLCQSITGQNSSSGFLPLAASPASLGSSTSTLSPLSSVSSPPQSLTPRPIQSPLQQQQQLKSDAPGKDKNRKKSKSKPVSKARTIKFHEYKGPPNAQKNINSETNQTEETSYQLMLEQQNCLLRFLEKLHKNQAILPAVSKNASSTNENITQGIQPHPPPQPSPSLSVSSSIPPSPVPSGTDSISSDIAKLEKMKVSDLKMHLKKRNLPVSGPKPQLIERLKPYLPLDSNDMSASESISGEICDVDVINSPHHSLSSESEHENMDVQQIDSPCPTVVSFSNEDIVREQQKKIDELQRQLEKSQQELKQMKQNQLVSSELSLPSPSINQKLVVKQQLEAKIQKQQAKQQAQIMMRNKNPALIAPKEDKSIVTNQLPISTKPKNVGLVWNGENQTLVLVGLQDKKVLNGHQRAVSMPSIVFPFPPSQSVDQIIETKPVLQPTITGRESIPQVQVEVKPPPLYEEATKQLTAVTVKESNKNNKKSENLTDVLDILIKNGELPESALHPTAPTNTNETIIPGEILFSHQINKDMINKEQIQPQSVESDGTLFHTSLLLDTSSPIQNIDMTSPMQPECHIDAENIFLEQPEERVQNGNEINHFDDLELLELMSQQLDMEIVEDTNRDFTGVNTSPQHKSTHLSMRRDMNPSLQPSINEIIQQQHQHTNNNNIKMVSNNGLENDFVSSSFDMNNSNNNFSSTPMDVCDDFDSTLTNFFSSNSSQDSNINTSNPFSTNFCTTSSMATPSNARQSFMGSETNICSNSGQLLNGVESDNFGTHMNLNQDNILDLFNMDDYKMTWGEVDFAV